MRSARCTSTRAGSRSSCWHGDGGRIVRASAKEHRIGLIQIHIAVLLAGGAGLFAKAVSVGPEVLTAGRTAFGAAALFLFAVMTRSSLGAPGRRVLGALLVSGALLAAHWMTFFHSIQVSTVAIGLLAFSAFPLFTTFLEPLVFGEPLHRRDVLTAILVTAGLLLVTPDFDPSNDLTRGLLWGLVSALLFSFLSLVSRACSGHAPAVTISFYQQLAACCCTAPFAFRWRGELTSRDWQLLVVLGVVFTALAQCLVVASLRHLRAQTTSVIFGLEPIYGIALAWMMLDEVPAIRTLAGGALICGAVVSASLCRGEPKVLSVA